MERDALLKTKIQIQGVVIPEEVREQLLLFYGSHIYFIWDKNSQRIGILKLQNVEVIQKNCKLLSLELLKNNAGEVMQTSLYLVGNLTKESKKLALQIPEELVEKYHLPTPDSISLVSDKSGKFAYLEF